MKDRVWAQDPIRNPKDASKWDKLIETQRIMREDDDRGMKGEESDADAERSVSGNHSSHEKLQACTG